MAESASEEIQEEANVNENSEIQREEDKELANEIKKMVVLDHGSTLCEPNSC